MSNSMEDVAANRQRCSIIGSNTTEQHPVFGTMLRQAVLRRGAKLIVADPRRIDMIDFATLHSAPASGNGYCPDQWVDVHHPGKRLGGQSVYRGTYVKALTNSKQPW